MHSIDQFIGLDAIFSTSREKMEIIKKKENSSLLTKFYA